MTTTESAGPSLRRRTMLAGAVAALGVAVTGAAPAAGSPPIVLDIIDRESGQPARVWSKGGRSYVAGRPGARYGLRVTNNMPRRVLVVMSVDGVNVLTGETAGVGQRGYVFEPYETYDVSGWRKSDTEVAAFTFAPLTRSYAARTGRPDDVGVIGVAAFTERVVPPRVVAPPVVPQARGRVATESADAAIAAPPPALATAPSAAARAAPPAETARRSERLGTGHGAREWSAVTTVAFERATPHPQYVRRIEYDSHDNLVAAGVIPRQRPAPPRPRPFPSSPGWNGYVPDPPSAG